MSSDMVNDGLVEMEDILKRAEVGRFALSDGSFPYVIPLNYLYQDGKITFHCAWEGKKLDIIATNPNCCFEVDEFAGDISYHYDSRCHLDYDSVLAFGVARIEEDKDEKIRLLQSFSEKYNESYKKPIEKGGKRFRDVDSCCCVVIDVTSLTGRRERNVNGKREKKVWQHQF